MAIAIAYSRAREGVRAPLVTVEVHLSGGLPSLSIVGLPETAVKESKDRVRGAILNSGFEFPTRRITINLAPADLPKEGGGFDLPIALGILAASGQIPKDPLQRMECMGELALTGELRGVRGVLPAAVACRDAGRTLLIAAANANEAALVKDGDAYGGDHLLRVTDHLVSGSGLTVCEAPARETASPASVDMADVRGQAQARRALEIAAAGQHNILFVGPPGTGKTMLASRLPTILPPLTEQEALEAAAVASVSRQGIDLSAWGRRTFRSPHHTASAVALVGGGSDPRPGEISLAHNGVLFLDEFPEFGRRVLEVLREPLESGRVVVSRAARQAEFPARFQLVAAMNPCPCGYLGDSERHCSCTPDQIKRYRSKISGPMLDRIDMHIEVARIAPAALRANSSEERSATIRDRVIAARQRQLARAGCCNAELSVQALERDCYLDSADEQLLQQALQRLSLSPRAYHRILKVARSIADLADCDSIETRHLSEAIAYRALDRDVTSAFNG